jgi:hypothetical protein
VASKRRAHIRENQQRPPTTPVAYSRRSSEEEELYKGKLPEQQGHLDQISQEVLLLYFT